MPMDQAGSDVKMEFHGTTKPWNKRNILWDEKDKQNQVWTKKNLHTSKSNWKEKKPKHI